MEKLITLVVVAEIVGGVAIAIRFLTYCPGGEGYKSRRRFLIFWICSPYHDISAKSPVLLRGYCAGFPSVLLSSPSIVNQFSAFISSTTKERLYHCRATSTPTLHPSLSSASLCPSPTSASHLWATHAPSLYTSLPYSSLLSQPPCCPTLPLSPSCHWYCKSEIAVPQYNLDINTSALDDFGPSLLSIGGIHMWLVDVLSPPTSLCYQGIVHGCCSPFVVGYVIPPLLLHSLSLHSLPSFVLHQGRSGGIG
jgi:hypothetical protein